MKYKCDVKQCKQILSYSFLKRLKNKLRHTRIICRNCYQKLLRLRFNKVCNLFESYSEREMRELHLLAYIDGYGRNAIDQGIINDINDPDFWEKLRETEV